MRLLTNLFDFERKAPRGERIFFRLFEGFVAVTVLQLAWSWGAYVPRLSDVVAPPGIVQYVDVSFLFEGPRALVNAGLISLFMAVGFLRLSRYAYLGAFLLLHLQYAARYSLGKLPHGANTLGMTLLGLSLAMLVFQEPVRRRRFTLGFTYFFVGLGYTISSFCKLIGTGLLWADGRHLWMWIQEKGIDALAGTGALDYNLVQELALSDYWLATAFLIIGLLTELSGWLMWWKRGRLPVCLAVIGLHIGIWLVMDISFWLSTIELAFLAVFGLRAWVPNFWRGSGCTPAARST